MFDAAQTIDWAAYRENNREVKGSLLDETKTLEYSEEVVASVSAVGAALTFRPQASGISKSLAVNKNTKSYVGDFILYIIRSGEKILKFGKGKADDVMADGKTNRRAHTSERKARKEYPDAKSEIIDFLPNTSTEDAVNKEAKNVFDYRVEHGADALPLNKEKDKRYRPDKKQ